MLLSRPEMLVIAAVAQRPHCSWREIQPICAMVPARAREARDKLLAQQILYTLTETCKDRLDRVCKRKVWDINSNLPQIDEIRAWVNARMSYPLAILMPQAQPRAALRRAPGLAANAADRVLEIVLRNPTAPWRDIRALTGIDGPAADQAREELLDGGHLQANVVDKLTKRGTSYTHRILIPNEASVQVKALRARYRLAAPATPLPWPPALVPTVLAQPVAPVAAPVPAPTNWLATQLAQLPIANAPRQLPELKSELTPMTQSVNSQALKNHLPNWKVAAMSEQDAEDASSDEYALDVTDTDGTDAPA